MARLERPDTVEALNRLLDRLDVMVLAADAANGFLERAEVIADSVSDSLAELRKISISPDARELAGKLPQLTHAGLQAVDLVANPAFERLLSSGLLERLGDPKTIDSMHTLLDHLDLASFALTSINEFLKRSEVIADSVTDSIHEVTRGVPSLDFAKIKETMESLPMLLDVALEVKRSGLLDHAKSLVETLDRLQDSGTLAPDLCEWRGARGDRRAGCYRRRQ